MFELKTIVAALSIVLVAAPAFAESVKDRADKPSQSGAREGFNQPLVLSHLKTMKIIVGEIDKTALDHGVTKEHLKKLLADELASTHVTICGDEADCCKGEDKSGGCQPGTVPLFYLKLKSVKPSQSQSHVHSGTFVVKAALVEKVEVKRNQKDVMVAVWSEDCATSTGKNMKEAIDEQVRFIAREFRRDYSLANSGDHD